MESACVEEVVLKSNLHGKWSGLADSRVAGVDFQLVYRDFHQQHRRVICRLYLGVRDDVGFQLLKRRFDRGVIGEFQTPHSWPVPSTSASLWPSERCLYT